MQEKNNSVFKTIGNKKKTLEEQSCQFINIIDKDAGKSRDCLCSDEVLHFMEVFETNKTLKFLIQLQFKY